MSTTKLIIQLLTVIPGCMVALASVLLFIRLRWPAPAAWFIKLYVSALSPVFGVLGILCVISGLLTRSIYISAIGIYDAFVYFKHMHLVTRPPDSHGNLEKFMGGFMEGRINGTGGPHFLKRRSVLILPKVPKPRLQQNVPFAIVPGSGRRLLCDIWEPHENIPLSGLAVIYLHGGAWYLLDKDTGTRPFFRHLSAQGHVIMDVAYRLAPETDMMGMIHDVKRAIHWLKEKAATYHINPDKIIVSGGSAGAHLALLAAYTFQSSVFSPVELEGRDLSTAGAISLYGPADLEAMYFHTNQQYTTRTKTDAPAMPEPTKMPRWVKKAMGKNYSRLGMDKDVTNGGSFATLLGCQPDQYPENYALYSPLVHVHSHCPPTLLIHGEHDVMAPVNSTRRLYGRLMEEDVPTMMHILPQTDHAFDLILPRISPSSHNAIYDIERFLALQAGSLETLNEGNKKTERYSIDLK